VAATLTLCERCGSIQTARARATLFEQILIILTRRKPFICLRCGWRARRAWDDNARVDRIGTAVDPLTSYDPNLVALDNKQERNVKALSEPAEDIAFVLAALDRAPAAPLAQESARPAEPPVAGAVVAEP
jgi:hypothetical protein